MSSTVNSGDTLARKNHFSDDQSDVAFRIAFVDPRVDDLRGVVSSLAQGTQIVPLDPAHDTLAQIADVLHGQRNVASVHVAANDGDVDFSAGAFAHGSVAAGSQSGYSLWSSNPGLDAVDALTRGATTVSDTSTGYDPSATVHDFAAHAPHHHGIDPDGVSLSIIYEAAGSDPDNI